MTKVWSRSHIFYIEPANTYLTFNAIFTYKNQAFQTLLDFSQMANHQFLRTENDRAILRLKFLNFSSASVTRRDCDIKTHAGVVAKGFPPFTPIISKILRSRIRKPIKSFCCLFQS